jgi:hypothetical protein
MEVFDFLRRTEILTPHHGCVTVGKPRNLITMLEPFSMTLKSKKKDYKGDSIELLDTDFSDSKVVIFGRSITSSSWSTTSALTPFSTDRDTTFSFLFKVDFFGESLAASTWSTTSTLTPFSTDMETIFSFLFKVNFLLHTLEGAW